MSSVDANRRTAGKGARVARYRLATRNLLERQQPQGERVRPTATAFRSWHGCRASECNIESPAGSKPWTPQIVRESWQLRPLAAKRLDWLYQRSPQSSAVEDRETLLARLAQMESNVAPDNALGFFLHPERVDRLALDNDTGVHDRRLFEREGDGWGCKLLISLIPWRNVEYRTSPSSTPYGCGPGIPLPASR